MELEAGGFPFALNKKQGSPNHKGVPDNWDHPLGKLFVPLGSQRCCAFSMTAVGEMADLHTPKGFHGMWTFSLWRPKR